MTDLRSGATRLFLPTLETEGEPRGKFLEAVREAAVGEFEILGELGRHENGGIAFLARDLAQPRLVALRLEPGGGGPHDYVLNVVQELDGSLPSSGTGCLRCSEPLRGWGRFCPKCGYDVSGVDPSGFTASGMDIEALVGQLAGTECEILGEMGRAEGGGRVYFAKEQDHGTIVGLRLRKEEQAGFALDQTAEITFLPGAFDLGQGSETSGDPNLQTSPELAATLLADSSGVFQDGEGGSALLDRVPEVPRISRTMIVLIVVAALTIGVLFGVIFS